MKNDMDAKSIEKERIKTVARRGAVIGSVFGVALFNFWHFTQKVPDYLSKPKLESAIQSQLLSPQGITVSSLNCPDNVKIKADSVFDCQATTDQGSFKVQVKFKDDTGSLEYKFKGLLILPHLEKDLQDKIKQETHVDVIADCGSKKSNIWMFKVGGSLQCDLLKYGSKVGVVTETITSEYGDYKYNLSSNPTAKGN